MVHMIELDPHVSFAQQLENAGDGPVVLVNKFDVPTDDIPNFLTSWAEDASYFKHQPGYISAQLHRGVAGSGVFLNIAVWESVDHFRRALAGFRATARENVVAAPHLFRKVAVSDVCVA